MLLGRIKQLFDPSVSAATRTEQDVSIHDGLAQVLHDFDANAYAASVRVYATSSSHSVLPPHTNASENSVSVGFQQKVSNMKTIQIYDKPMCCSTGICGPQVDPVLPRFAADLDAMKNAGNTVDRYDLSQQPQAFIENAEIHALLSTKGTDVLPVVMVNGHVVSQAVYPTREMLESWVGGAVVKPLSLPIAEKACCSGTTGCC